MVLCFSSFVFGNYQKYIPYYIYSISKTYPESFTKIIIEGKLNDSIKKILETLKGHSNYNFEILELETSFDRYEKFEMRGSGAKTMIRYLFDSSYFPNCDYIYIGDIDILFLPEKTSLLDFHINQIRVIGAPFSNKVRLKTDGSLSTRLTGLHFLEKKNYFKAVDPIIKKLLSDESYLNSFVNGLERDEEFLYKLNMEAFNFAPELVSQMGRPWHGLHLGITRGNKNINLKTIEENSSLSISEIKNFLSNYSSDKIFKEIMKNVFVMEYYVILKHLQVYTPFSWEIKAIAYDWRMFKKSLKKKIKKLINV